MGLFSAAKLFGMTIRESATDGSDFTNPDADYRRLFLGEDGNLHLKDSAGTVTDIGGGSGDVATDAIWDAAGDLAVGSGANTAARLAIGNAGGVVARINGAVAWNAGTAFPTAATGDRYWRTDRGIEYYYDGTRWLSTTLYVEPVAGVPDDTSAPESTDGSSVGWLPTWGSTTLGTPQYDWWIEAVDFAYLVQTTNDGTKYWTLTLRKVYQGTYSGTIASVTTAAGTPSEWAVIRVDVGALLGTGSQNYDVVNLLLNKTSTPGNIYAVARIRYRLVG